MMQCKKYTKAMIEVANLAYETYEELNDELMEVIDHSEEYLLLLKEELKEKYHFPNIDFN